LKNGVYIAYPHTYLQFIHSHITFTVHISERDKAIN
jgi:hypothetical protein